MQDNKEKKDKAVTAKEDQEEEGQYTTPTEVESTPTSDDEPEYTTPSEADIKKLFERPKLTKDRIRYRKR